MDSLTFLERAGKAQVAPAYVLHGDEDFLKRQVFLALRRLVLSGEENEFGLSQHDGEKATLAAVRDELATAKKLVEVAKAAGFDSTTLIAMPRIEANVAEVDEQYGFVVLDKGANDAVERGFTFDVHRDGQYLGRVKVDEIYANYATARIEIRAPGARMQRMDKASTHLN